MTDEELAETVLLICTTFRVVQELEHHARADAGSPEAQAFKRILAGVSPEDVRLLQIKTAIPVLLVPLSFVNQSKGTDEFTEWETGVRGSIHARWRVNCRKRGVEADLSAGQIIRVVRNAAAHLPDTPQAGDQGANLEYEQGTLATCRSFDRGVCSEVVFTNEDGFLLFLTDILALAKRCARARLPRN